MSDDLKDLVISSDLPVITKQEMRKTHKNQREQAETITKSKKNKNKKKKK
jgi:hypothetical protein